MDRRSPDRRSVVIDTDTASDDAIALLLAVRDPDVDVRAVTVVAGNVPHRPGRAERDRHARHLWRRRHPRVRRPRSAARIGHSTRRSGCTARTAWAVPTFRNRHARPNDGRRRRGPDRHRGVRTGSARPRHARAAHEHRRGARSRSGAPHEVRPHLSDGRVAGRRRQRRRTRRVQRLGRPGGRDRSSSPRPATRR